jgi:hypothetical protein
MNMRIKWVVIQFSDSAESITSLDGLSWASEETHLKMVLRHWIST